MSGKNSSKNPSILSKVAKLTTIRDIDIFEFSFLKTIAELLKVDDISLYKLNDLNEPCRLIRYTSDIEHSDSKKVIAESKEIHIENITLPESIERARDWIASTGKIYSTQVGDEFLCIYPIYGHNTIDGYLSVTLDHKFSDAEDLIISSLLSISQNFHSLLEENQKDKLTGLLNRKTFDENIHKIQDTVNFFSNDGLSSVKVEKRLEKSTPEYWLAVVDIDFFKKINDSYGHVYGDEVLLMVSQVMKQSFRSNDLLFRYGGEEFVIVINVANKEEAENSFERFRHSIANFVFPQIGQVTISLGATLITQQHAIASDIVGRADKALYFAKSNGRNKLCFYEELIEQGLLEEKVVDGDVELFN